MRMQDRAPAWRGLGGAACARPGDKNPATANPPPTRRKSRRLYQTGPGESASTVTSPVEDYRKPLCVMLPFDEPTVKQKAGLKFISPNHRTQYETNHARMKR